MSKSNQEAFLSYFQNFRMGQAYFDPRAHELQTPVLVVWGKYDRFISSKHLSLTDVAEAGGWKDTETLLTCYQQPDRESLLAVMSEPRKVSDEVLSNVVDR